MIIISAIILVIVILIIYFRPQYKLPVMIAGGVSAVLIDYFTGELNEAMVASHISGHLMAMGHYIEPFVMAVGGRVMPPIALVKETAEILYRPIIQAIKIAFSGMRGTSLAAIGTTLETVGHGLPLDTISDIAGICLEAFITMASVSNQMIQIAQSVTRVKPLETLLQMNDFNGGPTGVYSRAITFIDEIRADDKMRNFMNTLCNGIPSILFDAGNFVVQLISAFIPDDGGWIGVLLRTVYAAGFEAAQLVLQNPFELLVSIYKLLTSMYFPYDLNKQMQKFMEDRSFRKKYLTRIFTFIYDLFRTMRGKLGGAITLAVPSFTSILDTAKTQIQETLRMPIDNIIIFFETNILPPEKIEEMSTTIEYLLTLAFSVAIVMSSCKNMGKSPPPPNEINPEQSMPELASKLKEYTPTPTK